MTTGSGMKRLNFSASARRSCDDGLATGGQITGQRKGNAAIRADEDLALQVAFLPDGDLQHVAGLNAIGAIVGRPAARPKRSRPSRPRRRPRALVHGSNTDCRAASGTIRSRRERPGPRLRRRACEGSSTASSTKSSRPPPPPAPPPPFTGGRLRRDGQRRGTLSTRTIAVQA